MQLLAIAPARLTNSRGPMEGSSFCRSLNLELGKATVSSGGVRVAGGVGNKGCGVDGEIRLF